MECALEIRQTFLESVSRFGLTLWCPSSGALHPHIGTADNLEEVGVERRAGKLMFRDGRCRSVALRLILGFSTACVVLPTSGRAQERALLPVACAAQMLAAQASSCEDSTWHGRMILEESRRCHETIRSQACVETFAADPVLAESVRSCEPNAICADYSAYRASFAGCASGYLIGTGELMSDAGTALKTIFRKLESKPERIRESIRFIEICGRSIECKRALVAGLPDYAKVSDDDLSRFTVPALLRAKASRSTNTRSESASAIAERGVFESVWSALKSKGLRLECLDTRARAELLCWGAAYVIDPTMVAGAAIKGSRAAAVAAARLADEVPSTVSRRADQEIVIPGGGRGDRRLDTRSLGAEAVLGQRVADSVVSDLPPSMNVARYRNSVQEEYLVYERAARMKDGSIKRTASELPLDSLSGAIDANLPAGRAFLEDLIKDRGGRATLVTIDVDNLGFVTKNFTHGAKPAGGVSRAIGDEYLRATAEVIQEVAKDKAHFFRTGGDEFALVLSETDPKKVKTLLDEIGRKVRMDARVRSVFRRESEARARAFREQIGDARPTAEQAEAYRLGYAPVSQPNVSVGAVVVNDETISNAFTLAEKQAARQKIENKTQFAADTTKYGGAKPDPNARPNLTHLQPADLPVIGATGRAAEVPAREAILAVSLATDSVSVHRVRERFRVGELSVVEYADETGRPSLRAERHLIAQDGAKRFVTRELFVNERTGLIDGRHPRGREVLETFVKSGRTPNRVLIWVNVENLGLANHFRSGTQSGDELLAAASEVIRQAARSDSIPMKWQGSEFVVAVENIKPQQVEALTNRIRESVSKNPRLRRIYDDQERHLRSELESAKRSGNEQGVREAQENLQKLTVARRALVTVHGTALDRADTIERAFSRTRSLRYDD